VLGDSRYAETTQFDMVKAFVFLAGLPALPFRATDKIDIVNVDFVAEAIATLHQKDRPQHDTYHLSSGIGSQTFREITKALAGGAEQASAGVCAGGGASVYGIGEFSGEPQGRDCERRIVDESVYAVFNVEYGFLTTHA